MPSELTPNAQNIGTKNSPHAQLENAKGIPEPIPEPEPGM